MDGCVTPRPPGAAGLSDGRRPRRGRRRAGYTDVRHQMKGKWQVGRRGMTIFELLYVTIGMGAVVPCFRAGRVIGGAWIVLGPVIGLLVGAPAIIAAYFITERLARYMESIRSRNPKRADAVLLSMPLFLILCVIGTIAT